MSGEALRALIQTEAPLVAPSVYDGTSAKVARELSFKAVYVGSYAAGATRYGCPDIGVLAETGSTTSIEDAMPSFREFDDFLGVPVACAAARRYNLID